MAGPGEPRIPGRPGGGRRRTLAALRDLECRYDGPIPARELAAALTAGRRDEYDRCRAHAAIALLERHLASHAAMSARDRRLYRRWLAQWTAYRDALPTGAGHPGSPAQ